MADLADTCRHAKSSENSLRLAYKYRKELEAKGIHVPIFKKEHNKQVNNAQLNKAPE